MLGIVTLCLFPIYLVILIYPPSEITLYSNRLSMFSTTEINTNTVLVIPPSV